MIFIILQASMLATINGVEKAFNFALKLMILAHGYINAVSQIQWFILVQWVNTMHQEK